MKHILIAACLLALAACSGRKEAMSPAEAAELIESFTPEHISMGSDIVVRFAKPIDTLQKTRLKFTPRLKGELHWDDGGQKLVFAPRNLKSGQSYECRLSHKAWEKDFVFTFFVAERESRLNIDRVVPTDREHVAVEGTISLSEATEEPIKVTTSAKDAKVTVEGAGSDYTFKIENVQRTQKDEAIEVSFNAAAIGFGDDITERVSIPGQDEFKVLDATLNDGVTPYIDISFSDALDPKQELEGLITIDRLNNITLQRPSASSVRVLFERGNQNSLTLRVGTQVKSADGRRIASEVEKTFSKELIAPAVEVPLSGTILPDGRNLVLPFKAVNLAAVDVQVFKIYQSNVLHFLQDNDIDEGYRLRRAGKLIFAQTVRLDNKNLDLTQWQNFSIDLKNLFKQERGAIYRIKLSFRHDYSLYNKSAAAKFKPLEPIDEVEDVWLEDEFDWNLWDWDESDDPTKPSYYMESDRFPEYSLMASNIGLIAKASDRGRQMWVAATDIMNAAPMGGVRITAYNYQIKEIGSTTTGSDGLAEFAVSDRPFVVTATKGDAMSYLKVQPGDAKSLSRFDVGGKEASRGLRGWVYGERGVWRPGDTVHLVLVVEDRNRQLPDNHPVTMEIRNPQGQVHDTQTLTQGVDGFYRFDVVTSEDSPTGTWQAVFKAGGQTFNKAVRIETIVPNRLKIDISTPGNMLQAGQTAVINIAANWLTGPPAAGLEAMVERTFKRHPRPFEKFAKYTFDNPLTSFASDTREWGKVRLDEQGRGVLTKPLVAEKEVSGMMMTDLICRVAEPGGTTSIMSHTVAYSPYEAYVGVRFDGDKSFETDKDVSLDVVSVDPSGKGLSRQLEWKVYELEWSWWWEYNAQKLSNYVQGRGAEVVAQGTVTTAATGAAAVKFKVDYPDWGRYLVLVRDTRSGHASGGVVYIDWPSWRGRSDKGDPEAAQLLTFTLDKEAYEVGERATVYIPAAKGGRALVSIENSAGVLQQEWVHTSDKETQHKINVTKAMQPNAYVHITLLQPHGGAANDLPLRMYGVQPMIVSSKSSHLTPVLKVPDVVRPQQPFAVKVSEQNGKAMTYTLAIVDEGLLDISGFRTPDLWGEMNRREALGVRTWDIFDDVVGAYSGQWSKVLSIGGDEALNAAAQKEKRFNPVVKFMGPFTLRGGSRNHNIELPMYVGSVKVMVVAGHDGAYGSADKAVTVRSPLMVLSTLPRQISCGEKFAMPVNIFAMEDGVRDVSVSIEAEGPLKALSSQQKIRFSKTGDQLVLFDLAADAVKEGMAKVTVTATGGGNTFSEVVNIEVRNPHPIVVTSTNKLIEPGSSADFTWPAGALDATLEVAGFPAIDFAGAFEFSRGYKHLCTEQLSSRLFNMLYARRFLDAETAGRAAAMMPSLIKELCSRQMASGGFVYWPGNSSPHDWATSMAGQVLVEAREQSFAVPASVIDKWVDYQQRTARDYRHEAVSELQQAYRLYTLALTKKANIGAMNKLRETSGLSLQTLSRLAAAYAVSGRRDVAVALLNMQGALAKTNYNTFGSPLRDRAMMLETRVLVEQNDQALKDAAVIAREFNSRWCSTQQVAFVSLAMSRLADAVAKKIDNVRFVQGGKSVSVLSPKPVSTYMLNASVGSVKVENSSKGQVNANVMVRRKPAAGEHTPAVSEGVSLSVRYTDMQGTALDVRKLLQGQEFRAHITVADRTGTTATPSMALSFIVANGWEIFGERPDGEQCNYKDIRDDRVSWYFDLGAGKSKSYQVRLRATYVGTFVLPAAVAEDMYEPRYRAATASETVEVTR